MGYAPASKRHAGVSLKRPSEKLGKYEAKAIKGPRADGRYYWQGRRFVGGEARYETKALGWLTRDEAITELGARIGAGGLKPVPVKAAPSRRTVEALLDLYMGARLKAEDLAPETKRNNQTACNRLTAAIGTVVIDQLSLEVLEGYRDNALRSGASSTVRFDLRILRQAWTWGTTRGLITAPWPKVHVNDRGDAKTKTAADLAHVEAVEDRLRELWPDGWPWRAFHLLAVTGARPSEIGKLMVRDVDIEEGTVTLTGKHTPNKKRTRTFPLLSDTVAILKDWTAGSAPGDRLWGPSPKAVVNSLRGDHIPRAEKLAEVPHLTPYMIRRAAVRKLIASGIRIKVAAELMGHTPERMLRDYEIATGEDLREAVERTRPGRVPAGKVYRLRGNDVE